MTGLTADAATKSRLRPDFPQRPDTATGIPRFEKVGCANPAVRNTRDIDIMIHRADLDRIKKVGQEHGFTHGETKALNAVHLDLISMKLANNRDIDRVHIRDLDSFGSSRQRSRRYCRLYFLRDWKRFVAVNDLAHDHPPVISRTRSKKPFLRAVLILQLTGGHWYPSS